MEEVYTAIVKRVRLGMDLLLVLPKLMDLQKQFEGNPAFSPLYQALMDWHNHPVAEKSAETLEKLQQLYEEFVKKELLLEKTDRSQTHSPTPSVHVYDSPRPKRRSLTRTFATQPLPLSIPQRALHVNEFATLETPTAQQEHDIQTAFEEAALQTLTTQLSLGSDITAPIDLVSDAMSVVVDDSFTRCFENKKRRPWNWNIYLFPLWLIGIVVRYCILFPIRLAVVLCVATITVLGMVVVNVLLASSRLKRLRVQQWLLVLLCRAMTASWTGVIKFHGHRPVRRKNQVFVANHSSMIDFIVCCSDNTMYSVVGQKHPGWVGFLQDHLFGCLNCLWFDRKDTSQRQNASDQIKSHIQNDQAPPLLIFPEGTCVNNEYCVQFKKGVFELDAEICPIAIKYNRLFADAFWNSRQDSFAKHLYYLMTRWCVVADVYYLEPQRIQLQESAEEFANRVKMLICDKIGLEPVDWNGYLKFIRVSERMVNEQQKIAAENLKKLLQEHKHRKPIEPHVCNANPQASRIDVRDIAYAITAWNSE